MGSRDDAYVYWNRLGAANAIDREALAELTAAETRLKEAVA